MSDSLEQLLRNTLHEEAQRLTLDVSAARVARRYEQRRRERTVRRLGFLSAAAAVAAVAVGTFAIYKGGNQVGGSLSPTPTKSVATAPAVLPSQKTSASPTTAGAAQSAGNLVLDVQTPSPAHVTAPITCHWENTSKIASWALAPTTVTLFGEQVQLADRQTARGVSIALVRRSGGDYAETSNVHAAVDGLYISGQFALQLQQPAADPAQPLHGADQINGLFGVECGVPPADAPLPSLDPAGSDTWGTATLALDPPAATTVTAAIQCSWSSKQTVAAISFPRTVVLFGEQVSLFIRTSDAGTTGFEITRYGDVAAYSGRGATFTTHGYPSPTGWIDFDNLAPDPESYPLDQPLPSPIAPYIQPLGGNETARSLAGRLSWDCGAPPASVPAATPSPASPTPTPTPVELPSVVVSNAAGATATGDRACPVDYRDAASGALVETSCVSIGWTVPAATLEAKAGSQITFSVPGWKLVPSPLTVASAAEVVRWRGGQPDTATTIKVASSTSSSVTYAAPAPGDWVVEFAVSATKSNGSRYSTSVFFHIHVS